MEITTVDTQVDFVTESSQPATKGRNNLKWEISKDGNYYPRHSSGLRDRIVGTSHEKSTFLQSILEVYFAIFVLFCFYLEILNEGGIMHVLSASRLR
jgi:hypothetical protein